MSKRAFAALYRILSGFIALCLLSADLAGAAALVEFQLPQPLPVPVTLPPAEEQALFRTTVTLRQPRDLERVRDMGVVVLEASEASALLLVTAMQLEDLARLRFEPTGTDELGSLAAANAATTPWLAESLAPALATAAAAQQAYAAARAGLAATDGTATAAGAPELAQPAAALMEVLAGLSAEQLAAVGEAISPDYDGDGLTDTEEAWWCTNAEVQDSDNDGATDGAEVDAARAWLGNTAASYPSTGKPFQGWPPQITGCFDDDKDSVPDAAETWDLGLNPNRESTDRDKFDDGQELFGITHCTGAGGFCGYGPLPRNDDWGIVFAEMPAFVQTPGRHPLSAAFPEPGIDVAPNSIRVQTVTVVTTDHVITQGQERSYTTAKTEGVSTTVTETETWNNWQEVAETTQLNLRSSEQPANVTAAGAVLGFLAGNAATSVIMSPFDQCVVGGAYEILSGDVRTTCEKIYDNRKAIKQSVIEGGRSALKASVYDPDLDALQNTWKAAKCVVSEILPGGSCLANAIQTGASTFYRDLRMRNAQNAVEEGDPNPGGQGPHLETDDTTAWLYPSYEITIPMPPAPPAFIPTQTTTSGSSVGGSTATSHATYEEHTVTNGQSFSTAESWGTATAVDSAHAADLRFTYQVRNDGSDYARQICNLTFNIYIGEDPNPAATYFVADDVGGAGCFQNFMPGEEHDYTSAPVPLSLEQMKTIDLGGQLRISVEEYTYGIDEQFYEDASHAGVVVALEDGLDDGDEVIDSYLIPSWGNETLYDVLARYFAYETTSSGRLAAIWTPEYRSDTPGWCVEPQVVGAGAQRTLWCKHSLSTADWWNVYTNGLGDGVEGFQDTLASPGATALFRFNKDTDLDGYSDRTEERLGTDSNNSSHHPRPELLAGIHNRLTGNQAASTLSLLNTGLYDAYGIEAVMVAPDDSISITNNTVGGSGRVRAQKQVIVGSRILPQTPLPTAWLQAGHALPAVGGYYTGTADRTYTFTVSCSNPGGCTVGGGTWNLNWSDGAGGDPDGSLAFGSGYASPTLQNVGTFGLKLGLLSGTVANGQSFTVAAQKPRDTFQYTINRAPYTPPLVIVSYNDPQGNHRFLIPPEAMNLATPADNLAPFAGRMILDPGVEIVTDSPHQTGANTTDLLINNPSGVTLDNAHLFLEFVDPNGDVVLEVPAQADLPSGPTVVPVAWNTNAFTPAYQANQDYIVMAFWTDYQGNIIDTAARPLSSFQDDPTATLAFDDADLTWNFGTAAQGTLLQRRIVLGSTGYQSLLTHIGGAMGVSVTAPAESTLGPADMGIYTLQINTAELAVGPFSATIPIRTSDADNATRTLTISGDVTPSGVFGDGSDGSFTGGNPNEVRTELVSTANAAQPVLSVGNATGFAAGQEVLIIQMSGPSTGIYEFRTIGSVVASTITLTENLVHGYVQDNGNKVQVLRVPHYTTVSGAISVDEWDWHTGGILAFRSWTISNATFDVSGKGYGGGYGNRSPDNICPGNFGQQGHSTPGAGECGPSAHLSGGGGSIEPGSGGGGGYGTAGGNGSGPSAGSGGIASGVADLSKIQLGSGGGGGAWGTSPYGGGRNTIQGGINTGQGAGAVLVAGWNITNLAIFANGNAGGNSNGATGGYGGGGGSGGAIKIIGHNINLSTVEALGGNGGDGTLGDGGNGGAGRVRIEYCETLTGSTNPQASSRQVDCDLIGEGAAPNDMFGDGEDGDLTVPTGTTIFASEVRADVTANAAAGATSITVGGNVFLPGQEIFITQMYGPNAGRYEFARIASISANGIVLTLEDGLQHSYTTFKAQVIRVRHYRNVTVANNGVLTAPAWDGLNGGILVFRASGEVTVASGGRIDVNGFGYRGGVMPDSGWTSNGNSGESHPGPSVTVGGQSANGGGGGGGCDYQNTGGSGGSYGTEGSNGGGNSCANPHRMGYMYGEQTLASAFLGSGGGSAGGCCADGGKGGGAVLLFAQQFTIMGTVMSDGTNGQNGGGNPAGGAGSGGSIRLVGHNVDLSGGTVHAVGGTGGSSSSRYTPNGEYAVGGNGGVGRIRIEYCETLTGTTNPQASTQQLECDTSQTRFVRLPVETYADLFLNLTLRGGPGNATVAADVGNNGTVDWTWTGAYPAQVITGDLADKFNSYLTGLSGEADVPVVFFVPNAAGFSLTGVQALPANKPDATLSTADIAFSNANPVEGEVVPVTATLHNTGARDSDGVTAAFFATLPGSAQEWFIGSAFVPNIPAGGTAAAALDWDTLGFNGATTVRVEIDPYERLSEVSDGNNDAGKSLTVRRRPELAVNDISLSDPEPVEGQSLSVDVVVANGGQAQAAAATCVLYLGNPDDGGTLLDQQTCGPIAGGGQDTVTFDWTPAAPGQARLFVRLDTANIVRESDESNNDDWYDAYAGFAGSIQIDSGAAGDEAYSAAAGYGAIDDGVADDLFTATCSGNQTDEERTMRGDPDGSVTYRFDHLLPAATATSPGHFYHLDLLLLECDGEGRQQTVYVDDIAFRGPYDLGGSAVQRLSLLLDPAFYADHTITVKVKTPAGTPGGAMVSSIRLYNIDYRYADSGGAKDVAYPGGPSGYAYGWLNDDGSITALTTPPFSPLPNQTARRDGNDNDLDYQFDGLDPAKQYRVNVTLFNGAANTYFESVLIDSLPTTIAGVNLSDMQPHSASADVPAAAYSGDGSIGVKIRRDNGTITLVSEIALEEVTQATGQTNTLPNVPADPNPVDNATGVATNPTLSWTGGDPDPGDSVTYDVYLDTVNPPAQLRADNQPGLTYPVSGLSPNTLHYWRIVATDNHGATTTGPVWRFTTAAAPNNAPTPPANLSPSNGATNVSKTPQLCWSASSDPDGDPVTYDVYLDTANPPTTAPSTNQSGTCYTSTALAAHTTHYWRVVAEDNRGGSTPGAVWSFTTLNTAPTAPSGPNPANGATGVSTNTQVCWTASTDGDGDAVTYDVAFGTANPPPAATTGQSTTCYDPPGDLAANTLHYWRVTAKDAFGGATAGPLWSFTTAAAPNNAPTAPVNLSPGNGAAGVSKTPQLCWSTSSDPDGDPVTYDVYLDTANPPATAVSSNQGGTCYTSSPLAAHTVYYWKIVAKDNRGGSTPGIVWSFTTANTAPTMPSNPTPANSATGVSTAAVLSWAAGSDGDGDAVSYEVRLGTSNPPGTVVASQSATSYDPPGDMPANTLHYWQVIAKDAFGGSAPGPVWSFTTAGGGGAFPDVFYLSPSANVTVGGIAVQGADVLRYTKSTNTWQMVFDGSDHGLTKNITAFALTDDGSLLFVLAANQAIAGLGTATPFDVVKFTPQAPGIPMGAGTFSMFFQGQLKGLTAAGEKIDAIDLVGNRLLLSTGGAASVPKSGGVLKAADEDVFVFNLGTSAYESALLIDGSKMAGMGVEDINGVWDDPQSADYYITILGAFNLGGVKGNDKSIVKLTPNGGASVYTPSLVSWLAAGVVPPTAFKIDGLEMAR